MIDTRKRVCSDREREGNATKEELFMNTLCLEKRLVSAPCWQGAR